MNELKIIKAVYYDPQIGPEQGTDVTAELSAEIRNGTLFYNGIYNLIFPDHFKRIFKKLKIEFEYKRKTFIQFYNKNEKINLPNDIGKIKKPIIDPNNPWMVTIIGGVIVIIIGLIIAKRFF